jgi:AAA15 family ATPase/GTPase
MSFQSEIRDSQINRLLEKVSKSNYGKYLKSIKLVTLRGFDNEIVKFDFPVTALIGPNGGGKTTILGAAACAYKDVKPSRFFAKSGKFDDSMQRWRIEYKLIDRNIKNNEEFSRSASFLSLKWSRDALSRQVVVFGVSRTVPANERVELRKCASTRFEVAESAICKIESSVAEEVSKILAKDITGYTSIKIDTKGYVTLLTGKTDSGDQYSEFHFGAGESSVIKMVMSIESLSDNSLILIEEIENGLHPIATIRMVEYLIEVAERKKIQAIFTTHSDDALVPLPSQAIWASVERNVFQGKLDVKSLRAIHGRVSSKFVIFTEDLFAKEWIEVALRSDDEIEFDLVEVYNMGGDGTAVKIHMNHNADPSVSNQSICFIDGDSEQGESKENRIYRLPGEMPESYIYDKILENIDELVGQLSVALHRKFEEQDMIKRVIKEVRVTNRDSHNLYTQVGKKLGFISEPIVRSAFISTWANNNPEEVTGVLMPIKEIMIKE